MEYACPEPFSGCWLWTGHLNRKGYGVLRQQSAHRAAYELFVGPIPAGLQIDHLCRVRCCVNYQHMEVVTLQENVKRGVVGIFHRSKTHCPKGHPYDHANTILHNGERRCRECANSQKKEARLAHGAIPRMIPIECNGESHYLKEWARLKGISHQSITHRLQNGWSVESAINEPADQHRVRVHK